MSPDTEAILKKMGHQLQGMYILGELMGISYSEEYKIYAGVSDSSSPNGGAVGY